jgi:hypothetical protein
MEKIEVTTHEEIANLSEWIIDFKANHDRMPKRLPAPYNNYKLVSTDIVVY